MRKVFLIRHCQATGQEPEAPLTDKGREQANDLLEFFKDEEIDRIVSSPYIRAVDSIRAFAELKSVKVEIDNRLSERVLSPVSLHDWEKHLFHSFEDMDYKIEGGESSREAMIRGISCLHELLGGDGQQAIIVSHGNLISLMLKHYNKQIGFSDWKALSNPDIYELTFDNNQYKNMRRVWRDA
ncbi:histidine phosphatase family protein [Bacillus carboniphilus]|uniref:Histidine phosphatase family protein n=1 Tax=Bacillus carboniphilus TaxID=86663 RepID=A0ABN0W1E5_9BACI